MATYPLTAGTLPSPFCPETWQSTLNQFALSLSVTLQDVTGIIVSESTPLPADQDKLWIKVTAAEPYVVGAYVFRGGGWRRVPGLPIYFADESASANSIDINPNEGISSAAFITGRLFVVKVANAVTGATTMSVDSFGPKPVKKNNSDDLESGDLKAGQIGLFVYDVVADVFELVTTIPVQNGILAATIKATAAAGTNGQSVFSGSASAVKVDLTVLSDPGGFVTSLATNNFTLPAGFYQIDIRIPLAKGDNNLGMQVILYDETNSANVATSRFELLGDTDGGLATLVHALSIGASNTYSVKVQADTIAAGVYLGYAGTGSIGGLAEYYSQVSILKLA